MLLITATILGLVVGIFGSIALIRNVREWRLRFRKTVRVTKFVVFSIGIALAVASYFVTYPYGSTVRVIGFPFPAAAFEKHAGHWLDFSGPLTLPFMCANAWVGLVLPHLALRMFQSVARLRQGLTP